MILISACLIGLNCRYDGKNSSEKFLIEEVRRGDALPVCPEQLGGLPTPRVPAEIVGGTGEDVLSGTAKVCTSDGRDVTLAFLRGAKETLYLAKLVNAQRIIFKQRSPSCGCGQIYDGTFTGTLKYVRFTHRRLSDRNPVGTGRLTGNGVTTALLLREGFIVRAI